MSRTSPFADMSRGLGDPTRLALLDALADGPLTVGELVERLGVPQPRVSNHLAALRACGLVRSRRAQRRVHNELADERVAALVQALRQLAGDGAAAAPPAPEPADQALVEVHPLAAVPAEAEEAADAPCELVVFELGGGEYALPIASVREIVRFTPPRVVPGAGRHVLGIVQVHGRLLEVVDVRARLQLPEAAPFAELVVVAGPGRAAAMPVEAVREVVHVGREQLLPAPVASPDVDLVAAVGERLVVVLRPRAALGS